MCLEILIDSHLVLWGRMKKYNRNYLTSDIRFQSMTIDGGLQYRSFFCSATALSLKSPSNSTSTVNLCSQISSFEISVATNMPLTKDELRFWSRRIRMSFVRSRGDEDNEDARTYRIDDMNGFLSSLKNTFIDQEVLQYSRIHTALMAMKAVKSMHSERVEQEIEDMLKSWEKRLGCLDGIQADLYGPGGRLCGLTKWKREEHYLLNAMKDDAWWAEREFFRTKNPGIIWEIQGGKGLIHSMKTGHNGFQVGESVSYQIDEIFC